jgi:hypothetical protein
VYVALFELDVTNVCSVYISVYIDTINILQSLSRLQIINKYGPPMFQTNVSLLYLFCAKRLGVKLNLNRILHLELNFVTCNCK